jgi:hypothetical protein
MVVELLNNCRRRINAVVRVFGSSYAAQEFVDVDLQNVVGEGSVVVQVLELVLETAV